MNQENRRHRKTKTRTPSRSTACQTTGEIDIHDEEFLTVNEVAKLLRRHRSTILIYVKTGLLKAMRHPENKRILSIRKSQVTAFITYLESTQD